MKNLIAMEEVGIFLLSIYLFMELHYTWWIFPALLLVPDISMIGYFWNNRIGAMLYNTGLPPT